MVDVNAHWGGGGVESGGDGYGYGLDDLERSVPTQTIL